MESLRPDYGTRRRVLVIASMVVAALCVTTVTAHASSAPVVLKMARYAVATAVHDRPSRVVTGADVSNAADTFNLDGETDIPADGLFLVANLGELPGYPRVVLLISSTTFRDTCVDFPDVINGAPSVIACPRKGYEDFDNIPIVLAVSRDAIKRAAQRGKAVSGSDIVATARGANPVKLKLASTPTFKSGQGGKVIFAFPQGDICVRFPKTAYGIPYQIIC